jgi:PAS domain S-box-containing protein
MPAITWEDSDFGEIMNKNHSHEQHSKRLRELAERRLRQSPPVDRELSAEMERLVYELEVHQEELEIQNEELRRAQLELKTSRDRYVDLYDFAPVGYLTLNARGEIIEANLTAAILLEMDRSKLIGRQFALLCDVSCRTDLRAHLDKVLESGNRQSAELRFIAHGNFDALLETCLATDADNGDRLLRTVVTDITARKQAERLASEKDRHLRSLAESLPVLICYLDAELRFQFSNGAHVEWFGLTPEDLNGRTIHEALHEHLSEDIFDYLSDALENRRITFESATLHRTKGLRQVQFMLVPDIGKAGTVKGLHSLCIDITERKIVEQQNARRRALAVMLERLTPDERKVYDLLMSGKSNKVIAFELDIGLRTAERRKQVILQKLEADSVPQLLQHWSEILPLAPAEEQGS